jgi:hypothetical protein
MLIVYQGTSPANLVTGKIATDAIARCEFWRDGHDMILTMFALVGADNVER